MRPPQGAENMSAKFSGANSSRTGKMLGRDPLTPKAEGLYDPANEHDSCGVGFIAHLKNRKSHDVLLKGLQILVDLDHRGATGADALLGDGCGVLTQIPHGFFAAECAKLDSRCPSPASPASGSTSCRGTSKPARRRRSSSRRPPR